MEPRRHKDTKEERKRRLLNRLPSFLSASSCLRAFVVPSFCLLLGVLGALVVPTRSTAAPPHRDAWLTTTAYAIPKETTSEGSGYFSIVEGKNNKLYIGT